VERQIWADSEIFQKVDDLDMLTEWIQDPGHTCSQYTVYYPSLTLFWVMKTLLRQVLIDGDKVVSTLSADQNSMILMMHALQVDARLINDKLDAIGLTLGLTFAPRNHDAGHSVNHPIIIDDVPEVDAAGSSH